MPVTADGLRLFGADESSVAAEGEAEVSAVPGQPPGESFITSLTAQESPQVTGAATGIRIAGLSEYSDDPATALAEWVQRFASLFNAEQGDGITLEDDERNEALTVAAVTGSWTIRSGAPFEVSYSAGFRRGDIALATGSRSPTTDTPQGFSFLDGTDLGTIREKRTELKVDVEASPVAFQGPEATVVTPSGGATRRITIDGRIAGDVSTLRSRDSTFRSIVGSNQQVTLSTGFPGTSHTVIVNEFSSTTVAGSPSVLEYDLELIEGRAIGKDEGGSGVGTD